MKRVSIVVLILCAGLVSVAWGQQPPCKLPSPWAEFHRRDMMRWNPCEKVLNVHNVGNLGLKWSQLVYATTDVPPAVANGVVYVGSGDGNLYALKGSTGAKLWSYATDGQVFSSPAVAKNTWPARSL
jgi:hypothetical protein